MRRRLSKGKSWFFWIEAGRPVYLFGLIRGGVGDAQFEFYFFLYYILILYFTGNPFVIVLFRSIFTTKSLYWLWLFFLTSIWFCWISAIREIERAVNAGYHRWKCRQIWPVQNFYLQRFITNQSIKRTKYGLRPTLLNYNLCFSWFVDCIASKLFVPSDSFRTFHESALLVAVVDLLLWSNVLPHRSLINYSMLVKMKK